MKTFFVCCLFMFVPLSAMANNQGFLKCLGSEELYYHTSKLAGPYKKLNSKLISQFIQLSDTLTLKNEYQKQVCENKQFPPSLILLKLLLKKRERIFVTTAGKLDISQQSLDKDSMKELTRQAFYIFIEFINDLQAMANRPNCLVEKIPELREFYYKTRYILEDKGLKALMNELKDIDLIFKKLNTKDILKGC